jgi:predicted amidohydrolase
MSADNSFTAAMVQMRTGLLPEPSLEQGTRLIREAKARGADYVLTPEVSNMMQLNRKALFEHLASEEDDRSLKAYRALAAELKIHLHIGSLALCFSPERAVNRSFLTAMCWRATTRSTCSISTCPAARATASRPIISRARPP